MDKETVFKFPAVAPLSCTLGAPIVQCRGVSFSFPSPSAGRSHGPPGGAGKKKQPGQPPLLEGVTLDLTRRSRVVLVGRNGSGKSTLLKLIAAATDAGGGVGVGVTAAAAGEGLAPTEGTIVRNHNARVGLFTQVWWCVWCLVLVLTGERGRGERDDAGGRGLVDAGRYFCRSSGFFCLSSRGDASCW